MQRRCITACLKDPHEKCLNAVSDALELAQTTGIHRLDHMLLGQGVVSALNAGDHKAAEELLDKMAFSSRSFKPWEACFYHLLKTRAGLLKGDPRQASLHAEMALKLSEDAGSPISSVRCHLASAHAMHELGKAQEAADHLARTLSISRQIRAKNTEFWALLAEALFALDQGKEASALNSLRKALAIGKEEGYFNTFIDRPFAMARLCVAALEAGIEVEYVQDLIRKTKPDSGSTATPFRKLALASEDIYSGAVCHFKGRETCPILPQGSTKASCRC